MSKAKNRPEVSALLAERARFETWLDQLAAKASTMPPHVVARVRGDYETRLGNVMRDLAERADALRADATTLEERVAALDAELTLRREARVEDELRALVGEYDESAWTMKSAEHDSGIRELESERAERQSECEKALEMLGEATRPARPMLSDAEPDAAVASGPDASVAPAPAPAPEAPAPTSASASTSSASRRPSPFDEIGFLRTVVGRTTPFGGVGAPNEDDAPNAGGDQAAAARASVPVAEPKKVEKEAELPLPDTLVPPTRPTPSSPSISPPSSPRTSGRVSIPNFDPPSVPDTLPPPTRASSASPAFGVESAATSRESGQQRVSSAAEPARSLKCQECGSMNYPTEWYCEKCGGELAAF